MPSHEGGVNIHAVMWYIMLYYIHVFYILMHSSQAVDPYTRCGHFGSRRALSEETRKAKGSASIEMAAPGPRAP